MGRRPNQLILEYFERGPKLEDASNRYQHTCKSCGEKFPKGRIDSLTNHLVKKCPALPLRDRQRALLQFHELPLPDNMVQSPSGPSQGPNQMQSGQKMNLPYAPAKQLSALETLAEVSRQHLDLSGKRIPDKQPTQMQHNTNHVGLLDEFLVHDDRPDGSDLTALSQSMDMTTAPALPSMYQFNGPLHHSPTASPHMGHVPLSSSASMAQMVPSLVMAASAANELMPLTNGMSIDPELNLAGNSLNGMSDKFFQSQNRSQWSNIQPNSLDPLLQDHSRDHLGVNNGGLNIGHDHVNKSTHPRPIAMNPNTQAHFTTDFSVNQKPTKPKVRGRFSDTRRKEVQEVRKRGACIRCRMLKKPCSGDNPCNTCQNVESARLWKQPCIRTRVAEEFSLYTAGLNSVLAYHATNQAKGQIRLDQTSGRIEATHFLDSGTFATFAPLKCHQHQAAQNVDIDPAIFTANSTPDLELIDSDDDIGGKLDLYLKKLGTSFLDSEDSSFMKVTLRTASTVAAGNAEGLLSKTVELWHFTRIITSRNLKWQIFSNPSSAPTFTPSTLSEDDTDDKSRTQITASTHAASYKLIEMQLMGATEKRAACLARTVMNDLERRLLQRLQANPFETFLVAVILLACVERMCWLFRTWETSSSPDHNSGTDEPSSHQHTTEHDLASVLQATSSPPPPQTPQQSRQAATNTSLPHHPRWPFDKPPASFSQQGERFSDILNMLLKMRGVPPKPLPRSTDGVLAMWGDDVDDKVREWYDGIAVSQQMLEERASARFVGEDSREWELKYVGKIVRGD